MPGRGACSLAWLLLTLAPCRRCPRPPRARLTLHHHPNPLRRPQVAYNPCGCVYRAELGKEYTITTLTAIICGDQVKDSAGKFIACSNDTFANPTGERLGELGSWRRGRLHRLQGPASPARVSLQGV
jgi:hypothetical protein